MGKDPIGPPDSSPDLASRATTVRVGPSTLLPETHLDLSAEHPGATAVVTVRYEASSINVVLRLWHLRLSFRYRVEGPHSVTASLLALTGVCAGALLMAVTGAFLYWLYIRP